MRTVFEKADAIPLIAEVFRELGYEGATFSRITARTGLSKGSLYHFFPDGKEEMAGAVLAHIHGWFEAHIFTPLAQGEAGEAIAWMWQAVAEYFHGGGRVCLVGVFALDETRDRFAQEIRGYFVRWIDVLSEALGRAGMDEVRARAQAESVVSGIQGALVLARALDEPEVFARTLAQLRAGLEAEWPAPGVA